MSPTSSPSTINGDKRHWWLTNRMVIDKYVKDSRSLISTHSSPEISAAVGLLDAALALSPRHEEALELKARALLFLRRFRDVADLLQDYIPSFRSSASDDDSQTSFSSLSDNNSSSSGSSTSARERAKLLPNNAKNCERNNGDHGFRCFSVAELKRKLLAGLYRNSEKESLWRYLVLGQACFHLGMMEDAMALLQAGRRLSTAVFRRESVSLSEDSFTFVSSSISSSTTIDGNNHHHQQFSSSEADFALQLLSQIKLLLRRRAAALASLDAGAPSEAIRNFSKILETRRGTTTTPHSFAAACFVGRSAAYRAAGRLAEAIADCNKALSLDPASIPALRARADLLETVQSIPDCLRDLEHLKLLYNVILRDRKLPGPAWRPHSEVRYRDIPANLRELTGKIQKLRQQVAAREGRDVDYYALIGVRRGCTRSELERAHLLLTLRHRPDKSIMFIDKLDFADDHRDMDTVKDHARMSALILYRLLQKGYSTIMSAIMDEEAAEKQRLREAAAAATVALQAAAVVQEKPKAEKPKEIVPAPPVFQGVFCRDLAEVGSLLAHRGLPVKYEAQALTC